MPSCEVFRVPWLKRDNLWIDKLDRKDSVNIMLYYIVYPVLIFLSSGKVMSILKAHFWEMSLLCSLS